MIDVLEANLWSDQKHSQKNILLHKYYSTHNDPALHWQSISGRIEAENINIDQIVENLIAPKDKYVDCHAWFFDEQNFSSIFKNPFISKIIGLNIKRCYQTPVNCHEFIAIFQKNNT